MRAPRYARTTQRTLRATRNIIADPYLDLSSPAFHGLSVTSRLDPTPPPPRSFLHLGPHRPSTPSRLTLQPPSTQQTNQPPARVTPGHSWPKTPPPQARARSHPDHLWPNTRRFHRQNTTFVVAHDHRQAATRPGRHPKLSMCNVLALLLRCEVIGAECGGSFVAQNMPGPRYFRLFRGAGSINQALQPRTPRLSTH